MSKPATIDHRFSGRRHRWRVQSDNLGDFDEIVVRIGDGKRGLVLHAEMMNSRSCFVDVAGLCMWVTVGRDGIARITYQEDRR